MTKRILTTKQEIADYWKDAIDTNQTNVTYKNATSHCWRCGVKKRLDRCHIRAFSLGGKDEPGNFILLCKHCHIDNPNVEDISIIWDWLHAYKFDDEKPYWYHQGVREYEYIYNESIESHLSRYHIEIREQFDKLLEETLKDVAHHFGQPRNNRATVAGAIKITLNKLDEIEDNYEEK